MSKPRLANMDFLISPQQGAQDSCALRTHLEAATAVNTGGLIGRDAEIISEPHRNTETRLKIKQSSTDRKTHSNFSVSA